MNFKDLFANPFSFTRLENQFDTTAPVRPVVLHGHNTDVDTGTLPEGLWKVGGSYNWVTTASVLSIVSSSANDVAAGTGGRTLIIQGLDVNYKEISETVTLTGATPVLTTQQFLRINQATIASAGTGQTNAGNITITHGGTTVEYIDAGYSITESLHYTVPLGYTLYQVYERFNIVKKNSLIAALIDPKVYNPTTNVWTKSPEVEVFSTAGPTQIIFGEYAMVGIPEKHDLDWEVSDISTSDTAITARITYILVHNSMLKKHIK